MLGYALRTWEPRVAFFFTEVNSVDRRTLEWSRPFHETLGLTDLQYREGSSIVAAAGLSGQETRVLFVVRPDARRGIYDVRSDVKKELRSLEPGKITNS